jgi:hypothetical protein
VAPASGPDRGPARLSVRLRYRRGIGSPRLQWRPATQPAYSYIAAERGDARFCRRQSVFRTCHGRSRHIRHVSAETALCAISQAASAETRGYAAMTSLYLSSSLNVGGLLVIVSGEAPDRVQAGERGDGRHMTRNSGRDLMVWVPTMLSQSLTWCSPVRSWWRMSASDCGSVRESGTDRYFPGSPTSRRSL